MSNKKRCFVGSPIGDKDTDIRQRSDDLFDLVIEPALEKYHFEVTRADKFNTVTHITSEIIEEIQNCDLCIIDITGHNPNVMYECGRRHETGRPYIMLAQVGEPLPFDINTIRTIFYDLESAKSVREAVKVIQSFTEKHIEQGFSPLSSGDSLASVSDSLKRVERHLEFLVSRNSHVSNETTSPSKNSKEIIKELGATGALNYAFVSRNSELADAVLPLLKGKTNNEHFVGAGLTQACLIGSKVALDYIEEEVKNIDKYSPELQKEILGSYISASNMHDMEESALSVLSDFFHSLVQNENTTIKSAVDRAFYLNQYQRLLNGIGRNEEAEKIGNLVVSLKPDDASYLFNYSICLEKNNDLDGALNFIEKCLNISLDDEDHLRRGVGLYAKTGNKIKTIETLAILEKTSPLTAEIIRETSEVREILKS